MAMGGDFGGGMGGSMMGMGSGMGFSADQFQGQGVGGGMDAMQDGAPSPGGLATQGAQGAGRMASSTTPLTCHQVLTAQRGTGDTYTVSGHSVGHVVVCGVKKGWKLQGNNIELCIDDGTGIIHLMLYNQGGGFGSLLEELRQDMQRPPIPLDASQEAKAPFIRAFGHIKMLTPDGNKPGLMCYSVKLIRGFVDCLSHLPSVLHHQLYVKDGPLPKPERKAPGQMPGQQPQGSSIHSVPGLPGLGNMSSPPSPGQNQQMQYGMGTPQQQQPYQGGGMMNQGVGMGMGMTNVGGMGGMGMNMGMMAPVGMAAGGGFGGGTGF